MHKTLEEQIQQKVEEELQDDSLFVVDVLLKGSQGGKKKLIVSLDGDQGISIEKCSKVSRALGAWIEEEDLIDGAYVLEVSSYGVGRPLKLQRQYTNNIGRDVKVDLEEGKSHEGELKEVNEKGIVIEVKKKKETEKMEFDFDTINKTQVLISFKK